MEIKNQCHDLITEERERDNPQVEGKWSQIKDIYYNIAKNIFGYLRRTNKTLISTDTWRKTQIKSKIILNTKSKIIQERQ